MTAARLRDETLYARRGYRAALGYFLRAVALDPYTPSNTSNVAMTHERLGTASEASHWRRCIALEVRDSAARDSAAKHVAALACGPR